jgi:menaquinone-dependent protoporphyrinogen oxidase
LEVIMLATGIVPVFCATTEGQTHRIAAEIAAVLREQGFISDVHCLSESMPTIDWKNVRGVVVGASIHAGRHQRVAADFVTREAQHLSARPSAFFSVSLSAASRNPAEVDAVRGLARNFLRQTRWQPNRVFSVAGKLAYSRYGFFTRQLMRLIAWREGAPTDASRDYEFTDWKAVRQFALDVATDVMRDDTSAHYPQAV